ncbi:unnamed protein product [Alopecurus aequalis]
MDRHETGMDDVERQAVHGDPEILANKTKAQRDRGTWCVAGAVVVVLSLCLLVVAAALLHHEAHYYVAIDSVSGLGLNPTEGLSFNLTLGVYSWSYGAKACIEPGTYVQVFYRGVELAASEAETGRLCVGPRKWDERRVFATRVAGRVPEGQALEMKQGSATFDVALHLPAGSYGFSGVYGEEKTVWQCGKRQVGAATAWCDAPNQMPKLL